MTKRMLVDATHPEETRVAIVDDRWLEDFDFESASKKQLKGNIYLAKVIRIEPSLQAAFVEYGGNRHGFLPFSEIHPDYFRIPMADRPHDEEVADVDSDNDADDEPEISSEAYAEEVRAYQNETLEHDQEHGHIHNHAEIDAAPSEHVLSEYEQPAARDHAPHDHTSMATEVEQAPYQPVAAGLGAEAEGDLGLITDFGNAVVDPVFIPTPVEVVGGQGAEEEEVEERIRRPRMPRYKIQEVVKRRQIMLIQVVKEERGNKGAALTTFLSLAGRYCVLMPNTDRGGGVSRKITSHQDRRRLKEILDQLETPEGMAVILRTAGMEQEPAEIQRDLEHLLRLWNNIREQTLASVAPTLIYEEANLIKRSIRDLYAPTVSEILVAGQRGYQLAYDFMHSIMPEVAEKVRLYEDPVPLFFRYNVEKQIDQLYNPVVQLRSGGYIVINPTEALVSIDVNSGRATRERHIEGTALKTNIEAADEVARQLRLRDLAGLVVIDFIDMEDGRNNAAVERRMKEAMKSDRARLQIGRISPFGLMELSRQRLHPSLTEINFEKCAHCAGVGLVRSVDSAAISILRMIEEEGIRQPGGEIVLHVPTKAALYILNQKRSSLHAIEHRYNLQVLLHSDDTLVAPECKMERTRGGVPDNRRPAVDNDQVFAPPPAPMSENAADGERPQRSEGGRDRNRGRFGRGGRDRNRGDRDNRGERGDRPRHDRNDRPQHNTPAGEQPAASFEPNGNIVPGEMPIDDNIGNAVNGTAGEANGFASPRPEGQEGHRQGRRRGRRGGRGRHGRDRDNREPRPEGGNQKDAPREHSRPDFAASEQQNIYVPPAAHVPVSIHELDTTPRDTRATVYEQPRHSRPTASAPPPSPYEVTNPDSDKPKGGWWRKITGQ